MKKKTVTKLKWLIIIVVGIGLIFAILSGISSIRLYRVYAALEKDNRPMKPEDIIPPAITNADNAALLYESAILRLKAEVRGEEALLDYMQRLTDKVMDDPNETLYTEMESLLATDAIKHALACVEKGVERRGCRFEINYEDGLETITNFPTEIKALAKLLAAKAQLEAQQGKTKQAWHTIEVLLRYADAIRNEPVFIPQLVRIAEANLAVETIFQVAGKVLPDEQQTEILNDILIDFEDNAPIISAFDGDRILLGEWLFVGLSRKDFRGRLAVTYSKSSGTALLATLYAWCKPILKSDHATYLSIMHDFTKMVGQPYYKIDPEQFEQVEKDIPKYLLLSKILLPAGLRVHQIHTRMIAKLRLARTGLAILRYRKTHGSFPESLDDLAMSPLLDPFTGKQLIYLQQDAGFLLYSVGQDLQDDGGVGQQRKAKTWDIVWHYNDTRVNP